MSDLEPLDRIIQERFVAHQEEINQRNQCLADHMLQRNERSQSFAGLADSLTHKILRPKVMTVAGYFDNAEISDPEQIGRHEAVCIFKHTDRFPASARLEIGFSHDLDFSELQVHYRLKILPIFCKFPTEDLLTMPLSKFDEKAIGSWIDRKIGDFLDAYLRLEVLDHYQSDNLTIDPVCKMSVNRIHAPAKMEFGGKTFYFCVGDCQRIFAANPEKYIGSAESGRT
jgi:YHS domain-containing protein